MSRDGAIAHAERYFDGGGFFADLARDALRLMAGLMWDLGEAHLLPRR